MTTSALIDHNVSSFIGHRLIGHGHDILTVRALGLAAATDDDLLLRAARGGRVLITNNIDDFELLHDAWRRWSVTPDHGGILILFQAAPPDVMAQALIDFLASGPVLANTLYKWRPATGWLRRP